MLCWIVSQNVTGYVCDTMMLTTAVVAALETPCRDRGVVHRAVEREVELHVPLQPIDDGAASADSQVRRERVRDRVRDDVPMAGWSLGIRTVGPELGDCSIEVALPDDLWRVRPTGARIQCAPLTAVRSERVRADLTGRDVDHGVARGV